MLSNKEYTVLFFFFFQAEDGIRDVAVTGVQTCALPIFVRPAVHVRAEAAGSADGGGFGHAPKMFEVQAKTIEPADELDRRSEEHTSELQSRLHLVCRLLLEKKKKVMIRHISSCAIGDILRDTGISDR